MPLPEGVVTFLFTDIEGSTRLWERDSEQMRAVLRRHDELLRSAIEAHGGVVVKQRGEGDSFFAVFSHPNDAVAAACRIQTALAGEAWPTKMPIRVRAALHTAAVELRDGDYYGPPVNRCARIRALGHGGQTLLSQATYDLVREALPPDTRAADLGEHRMRDLARPEHLYQIVPTALPADFPPLKSLDRLANNLPFQVTSFVGREQELAQATDLLASERLLTFVGPGGTGKTRLALQVAAESLESFPDGVWLVELAPLIDPETVAPAVAAAIGIQQDGARPILETLIDALRDQKMLIILDNCEHLLEAAAAVAGTILRSVPGGRLIATSRELLGIAGERTMRIQPLGVPPPQKPAGAQDLAAYDSVRLFVDRATAVAPDFDLNETRAAAVASICRRLDGIPLAIELAAARVRHLPAEQIEARLDDQFRLLTGGSRSAMPRQQTLLAAIDWSYELLTDAERLLLNRFSVFAAGCSLEAAESICSGDGIENYDVIDLLGRLADRSLLTVTDAHGEARFSLLETIRRYANQKLRESGELAAVSERHLAWYLAFAQETQPRLTSSERAIGPCPAAGGT